VHWFMTLLLGCFMWASTAYAGSVSEVYRRVRDSVVVIETSERTLPPFPGAQPTSVGGLGSGFLVSEDGYVVTAAHVVQVAEAMLVHFHDGEAIPAHVVMSDPAADLALLKLDRPPSNAFVAQLADSNAQEVGDEVFVVGAPLGASYTLTVGHLSARRLTDDLRGGHAWELFQTDAAINQGNSGGPMFNLDGEVIGVVSHILSHSGGFEGLGFAVTSNVTQRVLFERRPFWSGMQITILKGLAARALNVPGGMGLLVERVAPNSPAERLGVRGGTQRMQLEKETFLVGGDIILRINGKTMSELLGTPAAESLLAQLGPKGMLRVEVLRAGETLTLSGRVGQLGFGQ